MMPHPPPNMFCGLSPVSLTMAHAHALPPMPPISVSSNHSGHFNFRRIDECASNDGLMPQISSSSGKPTPTAAAAKEVKAELKPPPLIDENSKNYADQAAAQK